MSDPLNRIRAVADYQFGRAVGTKLFPRGVSIAFSKRTGRIRYIYLKDTRLATMRPNDGLFSLSLEGARRIAEKAPSAECFVTVRDDVSDFVMKGSDVFALHVVKADEEIRARDEIAAVDSQRRVLAVGRAVLSGEEMKTFKRGVAIKVRRGADEES